MTLETAQASNRGKEYLLFLFSFISKLSNETLLPNIAIPLPNQSINLNEKLNLIAVVWGLPLVFQDLSRCAFPFRKLST